MKGLETVLARYDLRPEPDRDGRPLARAALIEELRTLRKRTVLAFAACGGALALVLTGAGALAVASVERPGHLSVVFAVAAVSVPWIVKTMVDLWQQKGTADLVLTLVGTLDPELTRAVVGVAAAHLSGCGAAIVAPRRASPAARPTP